MDTLSQAVVNTFSCQSMSSELSVPHKQHPPEGFEEILVPLEDCFSLPRAGNNNLQQQDLESENGSTRHILDKLKLEQDYCKDFQTTVEALRADTTPVRTKIDTELSITFCAILDFKERQRTTIREMQEVVVEIFKISLQEARSVQMRDFEVSLVHRNDKSETARHELKHNSDKLLESATTLRRLKAEIDNLANEKTNHATQLKRLEQDRSAIIILSKESASLANENNNLRAHQDMKVARIEHLEKTVQTSRNILADVKKKAVENEKRLIAKLMSSKEAQLQPDIELNENVALELEARINTADEVKVDKMKKELDSVEVMHENEVIMFEDRLKAAAQREQDALAREHMALLQADDIISKYQSLDIIKQLENAEMELRMTKDELDEARYKYVELMANISKLESTMKVCD
eukprot:CAMPEP_0114309606 /NCGR_PEP_ID=MMETSP0059-20121206/18728_1 /TAXON_ID=36894 /ORGANISM="Pyramimonas parkeae, Strain CCMP726" /LENGTH=407 /DNA_ID=CAMNT_0001433419 /DNA_START=1156 /DNA_END=2379 /DNA_ORIENTATION=-